MALLAASRRHRRGKPESTAEVVPLAAIVRSGFTEGHHRGRLVALASDGSVEVALGDVDAVILPRSSNKPMQAAAMVECGLDSVGELLALAAASHAGQPIHVEGVRRILAAAGLREPDLRCPPDWPADEADKLAAVRAGRGPTTTGMECSGKHASMLATCVRNGWPIGSYLDLAHPVQAAARATVARLACQDVGYDAIDGCGAPLFGISLRGLALAFRAMVLAAPTSPERCVADAMRAHPEYVAGVGLLDTELMTGVPGLLAKSGAEGVAAAALPDGRAVALKLDDGAPRARGPVLVAALRRLGVEAEVLARFAEGPVLGAGKTVGGVRAVIFQDGSAGSAIQ